MSALGGKAALVWSPADFACDPKRTSALIKIDVGCMRFLLAARGAASCGGYHMIDHFYSFMTFLRISIFLGM
jgi:hypothetical protein